MYLLYQLLISIILPLSPIIVIFRIFNNKEHKKRFIEKFSFRTKKKINGKLIWFHGASVGEILSIIPLIKYYEKKKSIKQILVTTSTLSSSKVLKKYKLKKTIHQFYPIDHFLFVERFIKNWKPSAAIFIDSEIWPCMFKKLNQKNIPLILLNARITKKTFNKWIKIKKFAYSVFDKILIAYPQNLETKYYLKKLRVNRVNMIGNLKFSENNDLNFSKFNKNLINEFKKKSIWVASSTHNKEEIFCVNAHKNLKKKIKNLITIIIPRHIHRVREIVADIEKMNFKVVLHSTKPNSLKNVDFYIVDTFGETKKFHKMSCTVFLGGSIIKRGGQNPLEAARFGAKILHGPNTDNFTDVYKLLKSLNISKKIKSTNELASSINFKRNKSLGNKIKIIGEKILKKTIKELDSIIYNEIKKA
jgi:3-deoxy-D-manno-octulosonic-acid transferase